MIKKKVQTLRPGEHGYVGNHELFADKDDCLWVHESALVRNDSKDVYPWTPVAIVRNYSGVLAAQLPPDITFPVAVPGRFDERVRIIEIGK